MADNFTFKDANAISRTIRATELPSGAYVPHNNIDALPFASTDSLSRLRVSAPGFRFDSQLTYRIDSDLWDTLTTGGSVTHDATNRQATLTANAGGTYSAIMQAHYHAPFTPGRSQLAFVTFTFGATPGTGAYRKVGLFDGSNGIALEQLDTGVQLKLYSDTSLGDATVAKDSWSIDPLDGTGPSGITLDLTRTQILVISMQSPYAGRAYVGFNIDGQIYPVHEFKQANLYASPSIQYASLPVRFEVGTTSAAVSMNALCASVFSEGGREIEDLTGRTFEANNGTAAIAANTRRPILAIRAKQQLNSINNVGLIVPTDIQVAAETRNALIEIVLGGTLTGASFASVDASSIAESTIAATAISGGRVVSSFYVTASHNSKSSAKEGLVGRLFLAYSHLLGAADTLTIVATGFGGASDVVASLGWKELR